MNFLEWSKSNVEYGRRLVNSAIEGAHQAEHEFLREEPSAPRQNALARHAMVPAVIGAYVGALGGSLGPRHRSPSRSLAYGLLGGAIGFGAGLLWENRELGANVASSAWKRINQTRDEHWFEKNPIDYA
jgi:hypothetical protein